MPVARHSIRLLGLSLLFALPGSLCAQEAKPQIDWIGNWETAFAAAKEKDLPIMVCINSKDKESANERAANDTYHDSEFVEQSRKFVMLVVSTHMHWPNGACPRFGKVTCEEHLSCWKALAASHGDQFVLPAGKGEMISPQHAWFRPDGTLLRRKEYELTKSELLERMRGVLAELSGEAASGEGVPPVPGAEAKDAPLSERDLAELERAKSSEDKEVRAAALGNLLMTGKTAAVAALVELLGKGKTDMRCAILRAFGKALTLDARFAVEDALKDREELVRSFAAVSLEGMAQKESIDPLLKRIKIEKDTYARKNMVRALGRCGGGAPDEEAGKALLKLLGSDKHAVVKKHAGLALRGYEGPGAKFVLKPLEQAVVKIKDQQIRGAVVYTLAYIGDSETTIPVLKEVMDKLHDERSRAFVQTAINICRGRGGDFGRAAWWIYEEDRNDPARQ